MDRRRNDTDERLMDTSTSEFIRQVDGFCRFASQEYIAGSDRKSLVVSCTDLDVPDAPGGRLSRISFDMFKRLFAEFGCEIVVINDTEDKADETEIFEEIISMLHCFAMKMYSRRRKRKLELIKEDLKNEISI